MGKRFLSVFLVFLILLTMYPITAAAQTSVNYALGKPYTVSVPCQSSFGNAGTLVTDGNIYSSAYITGNGAGGGSSVALTVYFEKSYTIDRIKVWHYWADGRTYHDPKTEISEDGINWTTVSGATYGGEYKESEQGKLITFNPQKVRYIRDWINGSDKDNENRWVEIQAFGPPQTGQDVKQSLPFNDPLESTANITGLDPGTVTLTQDRVSGNYAVKVTAGDNPSQNWVSYNLATSDPFNIAQFTRLRLWVKPGPGAKWLEFWTRDHNSGVDCKITSNRDADGTFKVGSDLESGKWNQVTLDLTKTTSGLVQAKNLWVRTNDVSTWYYDEITSVYSPVHKLDLAKLVNGQTRLVNGELQFKPSGANTYDTTPTILGSQNQPGFSRTDTSQADFQAGAAEGVVANSGGALVLQKEGAEYASTATLNADFSGTQSNIQPVNDSLKLATGSSIDKSTPVDVAIWTSSSYNYMNAYSNNGRKIARDNNGTLYVVYAYYNYVSEKNLIYCKKSTDNGSTWIDTGFPLISNYDQSSPSIAIDSHNNVHVVWSGTDAIYGFQIKYSKYDGTSWSTWTNIQPVSGYYGTGHFNPSIAIDSADNLHVVWAGGDSSNTTAAQIKYSKFTTTWSPWVNISEVSGYSQNAPTIAIDSSNNLHVLWHGTDGEHKSNNQIKYSKYNTSWSPWVNIAPLSGYTQSNPSVALDSNNNLHVVWSGADSLNTASQIKYSKYTTSWSPWLNIQTISGYSQLAPSIGIDHYNKLHVVWHGRDNVITGCSNIKYSTYTTSWSGWVNYTTASGSGTQQQYPSVCLYKFFTQPIIVWQDSTGNDYIKLRGVWQPEGYLPSGTYTHVAQDVSSAGTADSFKITCSNTTPANTTLAVEARTSPDGGASWTDWLPKNSGDIIIPNGTDLSNYRVQWRANLSTADPNVSPTLDDVTIAGGNYAAQGTYTSPELDISSGYAAAGSAISWNKADAVAGAVLVETRLSTDGGNNYAPWQAAANGGPIPGITVATDLSNARLQYRVTLSTSDATVTPSLYDITLNINGADPGIPSLLPDGRINKITINSSYAGSSGPLSALPVQRLWLSGISPVTMAMSGDGNSLFYNNPQDGGKLYLLDLLTGANTLLSSNVPREIKPNQAGTKAAFKGANNSLYLYDRSTGSTTTVSASAGDFAIQDDGTIYYVRSDSTNFYRLAPSASPPGEICLTSQTVSYLDVPKTGNQAFFSDTTQLFKLTLTPAGWKSSVLTSAAKNITGLWANSDGSLLFFKTGDGLFCYQVSSKSARKLDVTASSVVRVTKDNQLMVLGPNYEYQLYDGNTDSPRDIGPANAAANYTFQADYAGAKMAYVANSGLATQYLNDAQGPERYLLSFDGKGSWYSYKSGQWKLVTGSTPTAEQFQEQGLTMDDINALTEADFDKLYRDGREIYSLDVAIYFASADPFTTPSLKSIIVSLKGSLDSGGLAGTTLQKPLYAQKQQDFNATGWRRIKRIYTVELYPREAETYYFISTDGKDYQSYQNMQWVTVDPQLFTELETNWITLTQQGMTATALRSIPEDFLNQLLPAGNFSVAYIQKVQDASTQGYTSQVDVEYVGSEFTSPNLVLKVTLIDGTVKEYQNLTKAEVEDFMDWLSKRQYNRGPVFHKFRTGSPAQGVTQVNDYLNYYLIQFVSVEEMS